MSWQRALDAATFGPARRRRKMGRALARLDDLDAAARLAAADDPWTWLPATATSAPVRRSPGAWLPAAVTVLALVLVVAMGREQIVHSFTARPTAAADRPPAGVGEQGIRLLPPVEPPAGEGGYRVLNTQPKSEVPVTYSPCRPIGYVIRDRATPAGGNDLIRQAVASISAATGLAFVEEGTTTEAPDPTREAYQPDRYGKRWAPLLIAWTDPAETPDLAGGIVGQGGSQARPDADGVRTYVTGTLALDAPQLAHVLTQDGGAEQVRAVIEHELGHVVGLGHIDDPAQVMYPESQLQVTALGEGDRRGLAMLGRGPCAPTL